jgi:hypothetical protein
MTIDMTKNRVPYGLLTDEETAALLAHEKAGGSFEFTNPPKLNGWHPITTVACLDDLVYRTVPLPKTQDVIAWGRLPDWVQWVARDEDGTVFAYDEEPIRDRANEWTFGGSARRIDDFPGIVQIGNADWRESKQRRPRG